MGKKAKKNTLDDLGATVGGLSATVGNLSAKVDKLASAMEAGFKRADTKMEAGFKRLDGKMDAGFNKAEDNRESLARMIANGFEDVQNKMATKDDMARLEQGQEDIKLRLDSMAPHFEVVSLERRVQRLEDRVGIHHALHR